MPDFTFIVDTSADELAGLLPLVASNVLVALERRDLLGAGRANARKLAEIASRAEAIFALWASERQATKAAST